MYMSENEMLCVLKHNKEKVMVFYDDNAKQFSLSVKTGVKLKKLKGTDNHEISYDEKKYIELLKLNPKILKLEYSQMGYFVLISEISREEIKLPEGMVYNRGLGFVDNKSTLNVTRQLNLWGEISIWLKIC